MNKCSINKQLFITLLAFFSCRKELKEKKNNAVKTNKEQIAKNAKLIEEVNREKSIY